MAESHTCKALYAVHQGTYVLQLIGEIRVPICATLDHFIERMFRDPQLHSVVIDLSKTQVIDSTALGLLAKIAVKSRRRFQRRPLIISTQPDITRVIDTMGFEKVFNIVHEAPVKSPTMTEVPAVPCDEVNAFEKVLEAHRILMEMNETNRETFKDVVAALEQPAGEPARSQDADSSYDGKWHRLN
ncbi:MAG: STAS domain-containing protein [Pseudomonadota bacterium]|nr:anti-anti-sigma factor [Pseudomonadales bacterium]MDY6921761.1 STAS domain-containing protein [Pseudomonadota bacterium]